MVISAECQSNRRFFRSQGLDSRNLPTTQGLRAGKDLSREDLRSLTSAFGTVQGCDPRPRGHRRLRLRGQACRMRRFRPRPAGNPARRLQTDGSTLPILRKDPHDRSPHQPCPQRDESKVASESQVGACGGGWRQPARQGLHALPPLGQGRQAGGSGRDGEGLSRAEDVGGRTRS